MAVQDLRAERRRAKAETAASPHCLENLWVRLKVGDRLRPRDAELLRRLDLPPFDGSLVYELDARGYVIAVGLPGETRAVDAARLLAAFEARYGIPVASAFVPNRCLPAREALRVAS